MNSCKKALAHDFFIHIYIRENKIGVYFLFKFFYMIKKYYFCTENRNGV